MHLEIAKFMHVFYSSYSNLQVHQLCDKNMTNVIISEIAGVLYKYFIHRSSIILALCRWLEEQV